MGRAIVRNPQAFLINEPLSNLDAKLRVQMRTEIKSIHQRVQTTVVYVTHDQVEAMTLAGRIVVMNDGIIEQVASPQEMYDQPATRFVAGFIGSPSMNFLPCRAAQAGAGITIKVGENHSFEVPEERWDRYRSYVDKELLFGIRPEHVTNRRAHINAAQRDFDEQIQVLEPMGVDTMVYLDIAGTELSARSDPKAAGTVGESMTFTIDMSHMHLIDPATDKVI
jgi:multiple sugar transport system ATP-binding protein